MGNIRGITYPNGRIVTHTVNALGQLTAIDGFVTLASYNASEGGLMTGLALNNGTSESFTYDGNGRLASLAHRLGTTEMARFDQHTVKRHSRNKI